MDKWVGDHQENCCDKECVKKERSLAREEAFAPRARPVLANRHGSILPHLGLVVDLISAESACND